MAAQTIPSLLLQELGNEFVQAHEQAKKVKPKQGDTLPSGVKGIAKLRDISIKKIKEGNNIGKLMFYADAIIQEPISHNGFSVRGKRTFITEPIYNTPTRKRKTLKDHLEEMYGILKMLGVPVEKLNPRDIEPALAALKATKGGVFIAFRTWQPPAATEGAYAGKEAMLMQFWDERVNYEMKDATKTAVSVTLPDDPQDLLPAVSEPEPEPGTFMAAIGPDTAEMNGLSVSIEPPLDPALVDQMDLDSLAKRGDIDKDLDACTRLQDMARQSGVSEEEINLAPSWTALAELIKGKSKPADDNTISLAIGEHWNFRPLDPKTKAKMTIPLGVSIIKIDEEKGTVDLALIKNPKMVYQNIPATELEEMK